MRFGHRRLPQRLDGAHDSRFHRGLSDARPVDDIAPQHTEVIEEAHVGTGHSRNCCAAWAKRRLVVAGHERR